MRKKVLISLIVIILISTIVIYIRFGIFSYNLNGNQLDLSLPAYYSEDHLFENGYKYHSTQNGLIIMAKMDSFSWKYKDKIFTDSLELFLISDMELKPLFYDRLFEVTSKVDIKLIEFLQQMPFTSAISPIYENHLGKSWSELYTYNLGQDYTIIREVIFQADSLSSIRYSFEFVSKELSWFNKSKYRFINFIHEII